MRAGGEDLADGVADEAGCGDAALGGQFFELGVLHGFEEHDEALVEHGVPPVILGSI